MGKGISDALLAELLGDVGKLHDSVKSLPESMKASLTPVLVEISAIIDKGRQETATYQQLSKAELQKYAESQKRELTEAVKAALRELPKEKRKPNIPAYVLVLLLGFVSGAITVLAIM